MHLQSPSRARLWPLHRVRVVMAGIMVRTAGQRAVPLLMVVHGNSTTVLHCGSWGWITLSSGSLPHSTAHLYDCGMMAMGGSTGQPASHAGASG